MRHRVGVDVWQRKVRRNEGRPRHAPIAVASGADRSRPFARRHVRGERVRERIRCERIGRAVTGVGDGVGRILDETGTRRFVYNLTTNNLGEMVHYDALKAELLRWANR